MRQMTRTKKIATAASALAAAGVIVAGGAMISNASSQSDTSPSGTSTYSYGQRAQGGQRDGVPGGGRGPGGQGMHQHSPVTGAELTQVTDAVKTKDSSLTIQSVQQDPDGSYDVHATKAGQPVLVDVSKDLKTIEIRTGGPGGQHGPRDGRGPGGQGNTRVPGGSTQQAQPSATGAASA